jgi:hypothetical protein
MSRRGQAIVVLAAHAIVSVAAKDGTPPSHRRASSREDNVTHRILIAAAMLAGSVATPALAANTFQNTCSQIQFVYSGNDAAMQAVCLRANGTPNSTKLTLQGISNQNGKLTQGSGRSTFQMSCGNIQILVDNGPTVTLSAICRMTNGSSTASSLSLNNIANNNGTLVQQ